MSVPMSYLIIIPCMQDNHSFRPLYTYRTIPHTTTKQPQKHILDYFTRINHTRNILCSYIRFTAKNSRVEEIGNEQYLC